MLTLNSREIATVFWLFVLLLWSLTKENIRYYIIEIVKILLRWKLLLPLVGMFVYTGVWVLLLTKAGLWQWSQLKDTLLWALGSAGVLLFRANEAGDNEKFFLKAVRENIGVAALLEFVLNLYTFALWIEMVLIPFVGLLGLVEAYTRIRRDKDLDRVHRFVSGLLGFIGFVILALTLREVIHHWSSLATLQTLADYLLPFVLTVGLLPYIYVFALLIQYETLFVRVDIFTEDKALSRYVKWKIFLACNLHLYRLHRFSTSAGVLKFRSKEEALRRIKGLCK